MVSERRSSRPILIAKCYGFFCGRHGDLVVSALDSGSRGLGSSPLAVSLCCVLGQDTLLSQCPSLPRSINGYQRTVRET